MPYSCTSSRVLSVRRRRAKRGISVTPLTVSHACTLAEYLRVEGNAQHLLHLHHAYQVDSQLDYLVFRLGVFRKRCHAYSSRRYRLKRTHEIVDALNTVRQRIKADTQRSGGDAAPMEPVSRDTLMRFAPLFAAEFGVKPVIS